MNRTRASEDVIKQYLLGELSAAEQTALEDEYFLDRAKFERLTQAEDELIDRYLRGDLLPADRERFEQCYLTNPERRRHVKFAAALTRVADEAPAQRSGAPAATQTVAPSGSRFFSPSRVRDFLRGPRLALSLALTAAALLLGLGGIWLARETARRREQVTQQAAQEQQALRLQQQLADLEARNRQLTEERDRLQAQLQAAREAGLPARSTPAPVFFALSISAFRDPGSQEPRTLTVPRGAEEVRLRLDLDEHELASYQVSLLTADGKQVFSRKGLRARATRSGYFVTLSFPADKFASGDNMLALSGVNAAGEVENLGKVIVKVRKQERLIPQ